MCVLCAIVAAGSPRARAQEAGTDADSEIEEIIEIKEPAPAPEATASERVVDGARVALTPHRSADDLLELVPGLLVTQHGAEGKARQVFLRGFDAVHGSDVAVSAAGVPLNELSNVHGQGYLDLGFLIPEAIRSFSARKGSFHLDQGNFATAGSAELELGVVDEDRGYRAGYEVGTTARHRLLAIAAPKGRPESDFLAVEAMRDGGFGVNREAERLSAVGQWQLHPTTTVLGVVYGARFGEPGVLPLAEAETGELDWYGSMTPDTGGESIRALASARLRLGRVEAVVHAGARRLSLEENFTGYLIDAERGDRRRQTHRAAGGGARASLRQPLGGAFTVLAGAEGQVEGFAQTETMIDAAHQPWSRDRDLAGVQLAVGARGGLAWRRGGLLLEGGVRVDGFHFAVDDAIGERTASGTMAAVSPRIFASLRLSPEVMLFGAAGRGLRAPEARSVLGDRAPMENVDGQLYRGGEPRVTAADSAELGARYFSPRLATSLSAFATRIANEMVFDHLSGVNAELNETRRLGLELAVEARPLRWLDLRMDATAVSAEFTGSGRPIPGAPTLLATAEVGARHPDGWRGGARVTYLGARPVGEGASAGPGATVDLLAGRRFGDRFQVELAVDNVFDARVPDGVYHFASWTDRTKPRSQLPRLHYSAAPPLTLRLGLTLWM
jgi:outer membrane receptor protein involved in Fe transport